MLKTSCIKSLWPVLISILGEENSVYTYSNFQSDLLSSIWGLSSSQQELCNFCYTQTVSVTCVQVTFSNREKSTECGPNACPFSVPCDMNIIAAVQGADLTPPLKTASTAQGKYTKGQEVSACITPSFQPAPPHSSPQWMRGHTKHSHHRATGGR